MSTPWIGKIRRRLKELDAEEDCPRIERYLQTCGVTQIVELELGQQEKLCNSLLRISNREALYLAADEEIPTVSEVAKPPTKKAPVTQRAGNSQPAQLAQLLAEPLGIMDQITTELARIGLHTTSLPFRNLMRSVGMDPDTLTTYSHAALTRILSELRQCNL